MDAYALAASFLPRRRSPLTAGARIRAWRRRRRLPQWRCADLAGLARAEWSRIELGRRQCSAPVLVRMATALLAANGEPGSIKH